MTAACVRVLPFPCFPFVRQLSAVVNFNKFQLESPVHIHVYIHIFHSMIPFAKHESAKRAPRSAPAPRSPPRKNISLLSDFAAGRRSFDETGKAKAGGRQAEGRKGGEGRKKIGGKKREKRKKNRHRARNGGGGTRGTGQISSQYTNIPVVGAQHSHPRFFPGNYVFALPLVAKFKVSLVRIARRAS